MNWEAYDKLPAALQEEIDFMQEQVEDATGEEQAERDD